MISYIIADTGGVLWNSDPWIMKCFKEVFSELHEKYPFIREPTKTELKSFPGPSLDDNLERMISPEHPGYLEIRKEGHDLYRKKHDTPEGLEAVQIYRGVRVMLGKLNNQGKILIALTEKATEAAEASFRYLEIRDYFKSVQGTKLAGEVVTRHENILRLVENNMMSKKTTIRLSNTVFICGRARSAEAASRLGFRVIGATWGGATVDELKKAGASLIVDSPELIPTAVAKLEGKKSALKFNPKRHI